ncbi:MAG: hypothetical protein ACJASQ_000521 [Crocinitomicaceae bacterium]|jgi:hypothetical protein
MSIKLDRQKLKTFFETGDRPTEKEFINFIDSMIIQEEDEIWVDPDDQLKKVGIGTKTPEEKLDIDGNLQLSGSINGKRTGGELSIFSDRALGGAYVELKSASEGSTNAGGITFVAQGNGTKNGFNFVHHNQPLDKWDLSLRINGEGDVGIGTANPEAKLDLRGDFQLSGSINGKKTGGQLSVFADRVAGGGYLELKSASEGSTNAGGITFVAQGDGTKNGFNFVRYNQPLNKWGLSLRINGEGNVGIGTDDPKNKLHINVNSNDDQDNTGLRLTGQTGWAPGQILVSDADGTAKWVDKTSVTNGLWKDAGNNNIENDNSGNVGIGINVPKDKLHVSGNARVSGRIIGDTGSAAQFNIHSDPVAGSYFHMNASSYSGNNAGGMSFVARGDGQQNGFDFWHYNHEREPAGNAHHNASNNGNPSKWYKSLRIDGFGNVGVGLEDPEHKMDVNGSLKVRGSIYGDHSNSTFSIRVDDSIDKNQPSISLAGVDSASANGWEIPGQIRFNAGDPKPPIPGYQGETGGFTFAQNLPNLSAGQWPTLMRIQKNGNVGIGMDYPGYKLDVNGNANIRGKLTVNTKPIFHKHIQELGPDKEEGGIYWEKKSIANYSSNDYDAIVVGYEFLPKGAFLAPGGEAKVHYSIEPSSGGQWKFRFRGFGNNAYSKNAVYKLVVLFIRKELY